jgi:nucleoside-diphosphate-sugar epimerase
VTAALPPTVLVTGASGFLGRHACAALAERGTTVRGLVRAPGSPLPAGTERMVAAGLEDRPALRTALRGVEAVVHLAARVHQTPSPDELAASRAVNVLGTRALLEEAMAAGVRHFVFSSTVKAVGESSTTPWTEAVPPSPRDGYGVTKLEAEQMIRSMAEAGGPRATILRLPLVYGPGMKANALRLFELVDRGVPLPLGAVRNRRSLLFSGNFVAALLASLETPSGDGTFFVSDGEDLSTPGLVAAIARALGRPARLVSVPTPLLRLAGRIGDLAPEGTLPVSTAAVDRLLGSLAVDISALRRHTGYRPPYSVAEGLRITAEWYRHRAAEVA